MVDQAGDLSGTDSLRTASIDASDDATKAKGNGSSNGVGTSRTNGSKNGHSASKKSAGAKRSPKPTKPLSVGVVGCGYWGARHVRVFSELHNVSVTAIDTDASRAESAAWPYRANWSADLDSVVDELDAVVVAVPPAAHYAAASRALEAGCHVLVEKPLTTNTADGEELVRLAARTGRTLMVGHTFVYNAAVTALQETVLAEDFGQLRYLDSNRLNLGLYQEDVNVLWDLAPHDISIFNHLAGERPCDVSAWASNQAGELADDAFLRLRYPSGLVGTIHVSWVYPTKVRRISAVGDTKMAVYDDTAEERLAVYDRSAQRNGRTTRYHHGGIEQPALSVREPLAVQAAEFIDCIMTGRKPTTDGEAGLDVVRVLCAADLAITRQAGTSVDDARIPLDPSSLSAENGSRLLDSLQSVGYRVVEVQPNVRAILEGPGGDRLVIDAGSEVEYLSPTTRLHP